MYIYTYCVRLGVCVCLCVGQFLQELSFGHFELSPGALYLPPRSVVYVRVRGCVNMNILVYVYSVCAYVCVCGGVYYKNCRPVPCICHR